MNKTFVFAAILIVIIGILLATTGVFAQENVSDESNLEDGLSSDQIKSVKDKVKEVANPNDLAAEVEGYVEKFVAKRGVKTEKR